MSLRREKERGKGRRRETAGILIKLDGLIKQTPPKFGYATPEVFSAP